jgi:hypothetical protein
MFGDLPFPPPDFMERVLTAAFRVPTLRTVTLETNDAYAAYFARVAPLLRAADAAEHAAYGADVLRAARTAYARYAATARTAKLEDAEDACEWEPRLRALARTLPLAQHVNELTIHVMGEDRVLTGELRGLLQEGFVHSSISIWNISQNNARLEVDFFYVARLRHQMAKVVDPPIALLPHMMRQTGLDLRGRDVPSMPRQMSTLNATFLTLQRHTAQLTAHWEEEAHEE